MLALDPPLGAGDAATIGGVVATTDSGPLRHRYGGVRDLVVGITVALSRRHARQVGRQGDQERRRLRPRQAVHRLVRDARADRAGRRAPAPAARRDRHRDGREPTTRDALGAAARRARRRCRSRPTASTSPGSDGAGRARRASAAPPRRPGARRRRRACAAAGSTTRPTSRTTTSSGRASARAPARRDGAVVKVSGPHHRPAPAMLRRRGGRRARWSRARRSACRWIALDAGDRAARRRRRARRSRRARAPCSTAPAELRATPWPDADAGRAGGDGAHQGALRPGARSSGPALRGRDLMSTDLAMREPPAPGTSTARPSPT